MGFSDIFKSSFLQEYATDTSTAAVAFYLCVAAAMGLYIFLVYRIVTRRLFYNKSFNISLWVLTVITAAIIVAISSNIVLSLGMVGALSIVRYRTAIKDPMDLAFLFWAIAEGIICGAGLGVMGMVLALVVTVGIFILDRFPLARELKLMTISADGCQRETAILEIVEGCCKSARVKSRAVSAGEMNLVIEIDGCRERECTEALLAQEGVRSVVTLNHDGEAVF